MKERAIIAQTLPPRDWDGSAADIITDPAELFRMLALDPANPEHAEILKLNRATRYIETKPENYKGLEAAARSAGLL